jgi:hypothetical protein
MKSIVFKPVTRGIIVAVAICVSSLSCKKAFDIQPDTVLSSKQVYRNVFDADAAVLGLYGKLMGLAKQYVVLNELRADLMQVTDNADASLREINTHTVSENNPYADPRPFYALINDCNDVLKNFDIMLAENKFKIEEYNPRYSDVGALRSWLYLQVGIHYGNVPYVTDPLETVEAMRDASKFPVIPFSQLLDSLVTFTEALPFKNPYLPGTSLITTVDASNTSRFFIEKNAFLGDLNLWKGNYTKAATYYRAVMEQTGYFIAGGGEDFYNALRVRFAEVVTNNDLSVGYTRFRESDLNQLVENNSQGWRSMFSRGQDAIWRWEWLWILPFNSNFSPTNPFIDLFSNSGGSYLVKPSKAAMDNWNSQLQSNGFPFDARGNFTWKTLNGQPVITKYLYNYLDGNTLIPVNPLVKNGQWFLNRAANVHLRFAEAANRDGRRRLAYSFVNNGVPSVNPVPTGVTDVTNYQNTLNEPYPYNFDGRQGDFPRYRGDWHRSTGIRGRARLTAATVVGDSTLAIEDMIVNEGALELAYEGYRWPDLVRVALRRNDPAFLADKVYQKLLKDGNPQAAAVRAKLMNKDNWYLPFKMK